LDGDRIAFDRKGDFIGDLIFLGLLITTFSLNFLGDKSRKVLAYREEAGAGLTKSLECRCMIAGREEESEQD
jgi:hypothetical protein